jgi:indole-3-glycerol phosphate synthase
MNDFLKTILVRKAARLAETKKQRSLESLVAHISVPANKPRPFRTACCRQDTINIIAEVKKASPSKGVLREEFDPVGLAAEYERNGAAAISVLTEEDYFRGSLDHLTEIRRQVRLPLLRKDFVFDPYQIYESAATGADAVLLIAAASDAGQLRELRQLADELRLDALVEVHDHEDLEKAVLADADLIGINNRNLRTFEVDLNVSLRLAGLVPDETVLVSESGITTRDEINRLRQAGFNAFLIGEQFMKSPQPGEKLKALWSE